VGADGAGAAGEDREGGDSGMGGAGVGSRLAMTGGVAGALGAALGTGAGCGIDGCTACGDGGAGCGAGFRAGGGASSTVSEPPDLPRSGPSNGSMGMRGSQPISAARCSSIDSANAIQMTGMVTRSWLSRESRRPSFITRRIGAVAASLERPYRMASPRPLQATLGVLCVSVVTRRFSSPPAGA
jgi:hypothetical protein